MAERSTKPYLIRAIHEWACDIGLTPYISVKVDENTRVPAEHVRNGEIVLNLGYDATHKLTIGNDLIQFSARFGGVSAGFGGVFGGAFLVGLRIGATSGFFVGAAAVGDVLAGASSGSEAAINVTAYI